MAFLEGIVPDWLRTNKLMKFDSRADFSPLLQVVGAEEQSKKIKEVWGCKKIDTQLGIVLDRLCFKLSVSFFDLEQFHINSCVVLNKKASVTISIGNQDALGAEFYVGSSYEMDSIVRSHYGVMSSEELWRCNKSHSTVAPPELFSVDNSGEAKKILADQIVKITSSKVPLRELKKEGSEKIWADPHIPLKDKLLITLNHSR